MKKTFTFILTFVILSGLFLSSCSNSFPSEIKTSINIEVPTSEAIISLDEIKEQYYSEKYDDQTYIGEINGNLYFLGFSEDQAVIGVAPRSSAGGVINELVTFPFTYMYFRMICCLNGMIYLDDGNLLAIDTEGNLYRPLPELPEDSPSYFRAFSAVGDQILYSITSSGGDILCSYDTKTGKNRELLTFTYVTDEEGRITGTRLLDAGSLDEGGFYYTVCHLDHEFETEVKSSEVHFRSFAGGRDKVVLANEEYIRRVTGDCDLLFTLRYSADGPISYPVTCYSTDSENTSVFTAPAYRPGNLNVKHLGTKYFMFETFGFLAYDTAAQEVIQYSIKSGDTVADTFWARISDTDPERVYIYYEGIVYVYAP